MLCSFKVEKKNNTTQENVSQPLFSAELYKSITSQWVKNKPKSQIIKVSAGSKKNKWTQEEDQLLLQAVNKFGVDNWKNVALFVPGRTGKQCRERWLSHMSPNLIHNEWTPNEDIILIQKQKVFGNRWSIIATFLPGRSSTSVKNRWNYLRRRDIPAHSDEYQQILNNLSLVHNSNDKNNLSISQNITDDIFDFNLPEFADQYDNDYFSIDFI